MSVLRGTSRALDVGAGRPDDANMGLPRRCKLARVGTLAVIVLAGCPGPEPPPDTDTGGTMTAETGEPPPMPDVVYDGQGSGVLLRMEWGLFQATPIGTPLKEIDGNPEAGQVSLISSFDDDGLILPADTASTIIEDASDSSCAAGHAWAYFLGAEREFGSAFSFYSFQIGGDPLDYQNALFTSAPLAGNTNSGRVMAYVGCRSCVMFSRTTGALAPLGDESGTRFGSAVAVGFFDEASHERRDPWWAAAREYLAVGAPLWNENGAVHIYDTAAYRHWEGFEANDGDVQCDYGPFQGPTHEWRLRTLVGGFATEEFGRSLAAGDFNCDGYDDLAVGAPGADVPAGGLDPVEDAGAVHVFYGGPLGIGNGGSLTITQGDFGPGGEPEIGDRFGEILAIGNFDGSRTNDESMWSCWDLAVGTPNEDEAAGEVQIFTGDPSGLTLVGGFLRLGEDGLVGARQPGDRFGHALTAEDFEAVGNDFHDLAIGAPGDMGGGAVILVPGGATGLDAGASSILVQGADDVGQENEPGDEFGFAVGRVSESMPGGALYAVAIGIPGEDEDTGAVLLVSLTEQDGFFVPSANIEVRLDDIGGLALPGDRFGFVIGQPRAFPETPYAVPR